MSGRCAGACTYAVPSIHHQTWKPVTAPVTFSSCRTDQLVAGLRGWTSDSGEQRTILPQTRLAALGVSIAAAACRARRRTTRRQRTCRCAEAPGASAADGWFQGQLERSQTLQPFDQALSERGAAAVRSEASPARRQEPWRYTDLDALLYAESSALDPPSDEALKAALGELLEEERDGALRLVLVDGAVSPELSSPCEAGGKGGFLGGRDALRSQGADVGGRVTELLQPLPEVDMLQSNHRDALGCAKLAALNQALFEDCACLCLPPHEKPGEDDAAPTQVEVVFVSTGSSTSTLPPRLLVDAGPHRRVHVVETHLSLDPHDASLTNGLCRVLVGEGAEVKHDLFQQKAGEARFVESLTAEVAAGASYALRVVQSGARAARLNAVVSLVGGGASCDVSAVMVASGAQQLDLHSLIHHIVPGCESKQQHKNLVADAAECIFKGSIVVDKEAQQTRSSQLCRSLLLSKRAKVKAMPSLRIRADDVTCSHGAAITELDEDELFYMAARGLSGDEARRLLLTAFPQDLIAGLKAESPKAYKRVLVKLKSLADSQGSSKVDRVPT
mmetsp:Transcript_125637/g.391190  ORF Transcript_125637/g.391190 Transcript_125637/m.391190 type:complete len:560 (+) Transcript_125637:2-1681(+)